MKPLRIGCGAGFSGDRLDPAIELATRGNLDYLVLECLAERTIALAQQARVRSPESGYDPLLTERIAALLPPCVEHDTTIITNMGAANPTAAAAIVKDIAQATWAPWPHDRHGDRRRCIGAGPRSAMP